MNQHQRKFLLEAIEKQYKLEINALRERKPKSVSLNNYLIAAILDGSFVMKSQDTIRDAFRQRVRSLGKGKALVSTAEDRWGNREKDNEDVIQIPVDVLFEYPAEYAVERAKYEQALKVWEEEMEALEASINAMRIKVQVGSDKALEALVDQADAICTMSLTASNKLLGAGSSQKQLAQGGK
jgi:hypothetical protein